MLFTEFFYKILLYFITPLCKPVANSVLLAGKSNFWNLNFLCSADTKKIFFRIEELSKQNGVCFITSIWFDCTTHVWSCILKKALGSSKSLQCAYCRPNASSICAANSIFDECKFQIFKYFFGRVEWEILTNLPTPICSLRNRSWK